MAQPPVGAGHSVPLDLRNPRELRHSPAGSQPAYGPLASGRGVGFGAEQPWRRCHVEHYAWSTLVSGSACSDRDSYSLDGRKALAHAVTLANRSCVVETDHS